MNDDLPVFVVIPTQAKGEPEKWGLWSNNYQCWMHKQFHRNRNDAISHAKELGFVCVDNDNHHPLTFPQKGVP